MKLLIVDDELPIRKGLEHGIDWADIGIDQVFSSTSIRALETARPTCELLNLQPTPLSFCHEDLAYRDLHVTDQNGESTWCFYDKEISRLFAGNDIRRLGQAWYDHPALQQYGFGKGIERIQRETDAFLLSLGYEHDRENNLYRIVQPNEKRIALFAHQGFGLAFLSCVLDIPYPQFAPHFDMSHTGMSVIQFQDEGGYAIPRALTIANDAHLYREGLPTRYHNELPAF